jgi:osmotically-inducible protein OsmY
MRKLLLLAMVCSVGVAPGCAVTNATLKNDDGRTVVRSIQDIDAARTIRARMTRAHGFKLGGVDVEVREGVALLSGRVPRPEDRIEAERIAWSAPQVESIGNEVRIGDKQSTFRNVKDGVLEKTVRTRLIASGDVAARDLNIETHEGIVYMLGMVDDLAERDRATEIVSKTRGVREVVSYIKIRDEMPTPGGEFASAPGMAPVAGVAPIPVPSYELPEEVVGSAPVVPAMPLSAPSAGGAVTALPSPEPVFRDPVTGERVDLPEGTQVLPYAPAAPSIPAKPDERSEYKDGNGVPFYIDPDSGKRIPVTYRQFIPVP